MLPKRGDGFDFVLFSYHIAVFGADFFHPAHGKAADWSDGGIGICGDHAGGKPGVNPHAGQRHPAAVGSGAHSDGAGTGAGAVLWYLEKYGSSAAAVRQAGDPH